MRNAVYTSRKILFDTPEINETPSYGALLENTYRIHRYGCVCVCVFTRNAIRFVDTLFALICNF